MHNARRRRAFSLIRIGVAAVAILAVVYIALIATVMSYAATTVDFAQSVRNDETAVATLDSQYFQAISAITHIDYADAGYAKPASVTYVPVQKPQTALR